MQVNGNAETLDLEPVMHRKFKRFPRYFKGMSKNNVRYSYELFELHIFSERK